LGPISLFIENILGFHQFNAETQEIYWRITKKCKHGIQNLHLGSNIISLIYNPSQFLEIKCHNPIHIHISDEKGKITKTIDANPTQTKYPL
jgi:hypothetical protein